MAVCCMMILFDPLAVHIMLLASPGGSAARHELKRVIVAAAIKIFVSETAAGRGTFTLRELSRFGCISKEGPLCVLVKEIFVSEPHCHFLICDC